MAEQGQEQELQEIQIAGESSHINIKVRSENQGEVHLRVKRTTPFLKVFNAYCERVGKPLTGVRFMLDGDTVEQDATPGQLGMEDGDFIEAFITQLGGNQT